jgi:uncharacterized membrane protein
MSMGHLRLSEHINAPIDQVWELNASCERLPEWNTNIVEVRDCPDRLDRVGARVTTVARIFGRRIEGTQETTKADKPHSYALKFSGAGGVKGTVDITNTEARGGTDGTIDVDYDLPMGLFAGVAEKLLGGFLERDLRHSMENFKALCEATVPAHV